MNKGSQTDYRSANLNTRQGSKLFSHLDNPNSTTSRISPTLKVERTSNGHIFHQEGTDGIFKPVATIPHKQANVFRDHLRQYE
jgi:hypothetical protein